MIDAHSLHILEFGSVLERLAEHTSNGIGREFALQLEPLPYPETVLRRLQETREARELRESDSGLPLGGIRDVRETLERARVETQLTGYELLDVIYTACASRRIRVFLTNRREKAPLLSETASNLPVLQVLEQRIEACIGEGGDVKDGASALLGKLRSQIKIAAARLTDKLQGLLGSERSRTHIQEFVVTVREGRYCIPVKAEHAKAFGGIIHDSSQSGATVFIEPAQTVELGNELKQLAVKEEQEVSRILRELSALTASYFGELQQMVSILGHLDVANAKAALAEEMDAVEPAVNRKGITRLVSARHPLLPGKVVPIDIEVGDRFTTLLITGPNTGGKTVTLKTIGLLTLMTLAGMQIPAGANSDIALFDQVFADIGDEQDIQQSLSTFSAHLKNIVNIVETIGSNALVLMDEVGAGTDPAEGAALAKSLLDHLMERGARVVATTHYGELKEYAYTRTGVENSSVEFDIQSLAPTYRVLLGVPGSSNALYIASRLGLRDEIIAEAREFLSHREIETGELLQQIEKSRRAASEAERMAARARDEAYAARTEYQTRVQQISLAQQAVKQQAQEEARNVLKRATDKAENILKDLQRLNKGARKAPGVRQRLNTLRTETNAALAVEIPDPIPDIPFDPNHSYRSGDRVRVISLNMDGQLLEAPRDGSAPIQIGAMRITLPVSQIRPQSKQDAGASKTSARTPAALSGASEIATRKAMLIAPELMLRALRAEEAQSMLDKYLDDAFAAGLSQVRLVHGKGSGVLRRVVWEVLENHPAVKSKRLGEESEGGDGVTVVTLLSQ